MDPRYGEGYLEDRNQPSELRVAAAIGELGELIDISNQTDIYVERQSFRFDRDNENGAITTLSFDAILQNKAYAEIPTRRYISVDDPDLTNGLGGYAGLFSGEIISTTVKEEGDHRIVNIRCNDWGDLMRRPPKQITTPWPPGDGTPVVDTTVEAPLTAGTGIVVTPRSMRHIYVGKKLYASNSDGTNQERITVTAVTATTFTADFDTDKDSTETTVQLSLHATGLQTIEPDSMDNINVGSLIYCYKTHGVQTVGNEWTVVESVTATTFDARFNAWKTHDWVVRSEWRVFGGVTDKELIADGFYMDLDTVNETTGDIETDRVFIPSLLDEFFNNEGLQVFKNAVHEIILSLPHGQWEATDPAEVMNWIVEQNKDLAKQPSWYMSFKQSTSTSLGILPPMLRYYDAKDSSLLAPVSLTNSQLTFQRDEMARFIEYARTEDGTAFANRQTVRGSNFAQGSWNDLDSQSDPEAFNWVGRVIEAPVVVENNLTTNEECELYAEQLANELKLSQRPRPVTVTTYAKLSPFIFYEPSRVAFDAIWEQDLPADMDVVRVSLSFSEEGLAVYDFQLGIRRIPWLPGHVRVPRNTRRANVLTGPRGKIKSVSHPVTRYVNTHTMARGEADLYVAETTDIDSDDIKFYLPPAFLYPGLPIAVKVPSNVPKPVTVIPYNRNGVADSIDGAMELVVPPGGTVHLQSAGEHDQTGHGGVYHVTSSAGPAGVITLKWNYVIPVPQLDPDKLLVTDGTVKGWRVEADAVGDIEIDVTRNGVSITDGNYITLDGAQINSGDTSTWDQDLIEYQDDDIISFEIISATGISKVTVGLQVERQGNVPGSTTIINGDVIGVTDHGELTGLGDDDHTQYFNTTRGDARYEQLANLPEDVYQLVVGILQAGTNITLTPNDTLNTIGIAASFTPSFTGLTAAHNIAIFTADPDRFHFKLGYACTITGWEVYNAAEASASVELDIWKDTYTNWPHTSSESITGSNRPKLVSQAKNSGNTTGWSATAVGSADTLSINAVSFSGLDKAILVLFTTRT